MASVYNFLLTSLGYDANHIFYPEVQIDLFFLKK